MKLDRNHYDYELLRDEDKRKIRIIKPEYVDQLIAEFEAMKKDGAYNKIKEKYSIK